MGMSPVLDPKGLLQGGKGYLILRPHQHVYIYMYMNISVCIWLQKFAGVKLAVLTCCLIYEVIS